MIRPVLRSARFVRVAKRFVKKRPLAVPMIANVALLLGMDAFDPRLGSHRLHGKLTGIWACSGGYDLRVLFELVAVDGVECVLLITIGTHDQIY